MNKLTREQLKENLSKIKEEKAKDYIDIEGREPYITCYCPLPLHRNITHRSQCKYFKSEQGRECPYYTQCISPAHCVHFEERPKVNQRKVNK